MNPLYPIEWAVAWIMVKFHALLGLFMDPNSGWTWMLSIVGLTVVVRVIITPLFVRQIRSSRAMQAVSPQLQALQKRYKGKTDPESRQKMAAEMQAVYKEAGASPLSSCLPLLLQMPIFFALFRVLFYKLKDAAAGEAFGPLTVDLAQRAYHGTLLGGTTIADSFLNTGDGGISAKVIAGIIIALMCLTTFITQKELTMRNMPPSALEGPMASTQKMMMYMLPFIYVITGPGMPIGVLMYWLTTSLWTLGQQLIVVLTYPTPGSPAETTRHHRINARTTPPPSGCSPRRPPAARSSPTRSASSRPAPRARRPRRSAAPPRRRRAPSRRTPPRALLSARRTRARRSAASDPAGRGRRRPRPRHPVSPASRRSP